MEGWERLIRLSGKKVLEYTIHVRHLSKGRFKEELGFKIFISKNDIISLQPVMDCKFFKGRNGIKPWIEIYFNDIVGMSDGTKVNLRDRSADDRLFFLISRLIPEGGSIMVSYLNHEDTMKELQAGVPPQATYIGFILLKCGCTWFKDWYYAEGWLEGDVKLQGTKPDNKKKMLSDLRRLADELDLFLKNDAKYVPEGLKPNVIDRVADVMTFISSLLQSYF